MRCDEDKNAIFDANGKLESTFIFLNYIYNLFVFFFMNVSDLYDNTEWRRLQYEIT